MPTILYWGLQTLIVLVVAALATILLISLNQKVQKRTYRKQQVEDFTHKTGLTELAKARERFNAGGPVGPVRPDGEVARVVRNPDPITLPWEAEQRCRHNRLMTQSCHEGLCWRDHA